MELVLMPHSSPELWDQAIAAYDSKGLFHQSAWLNYLEASQGGQAVRLRISDGGQTVGYFAGILIRKGPMRVLGSPLRGWQTNFTGPLVNEGFDAAGFLDALERWWEANRIQHLEIVSPVLAPELMKRAGYAIEEDLTYLVFLDPDRERMWKNLRSDCRNRIRQAIRNGLMVEVARDRAFIEEYYRELREVFAIKGLAPVYPIERIFCLFEHLPPEHLLGLEVRDEDRVLATGIFVRDARCVYWFGGASWKRFQHLSPNEILQWAAMEMSAREGISLYNMCGDGSFKPKFGAVRTPVFKYIKSFHPLARVGRELYRAACYARQRIAGRFGSGWRRSTETEASGRKGALYRGGIA